MSTIKIIELYDKSKVPFTFFLFPFFLLKKYSQKGVNIIQSEENVKTVSVTNEQIPSHVFVMRFKPKSYSSCNMILVATLSVEFLT